MSHLHHCPQNGISVFCIDIVNQPLVQLNAVHRILLQIRKGCKALPKIVQRNFHPVFFKDQHVFPDLGRLFYPGTLRQFKDQQLSRKLVAVYDFHTSGRKIGRGERIPGEVAGEEKAAHTLADQFLQEGTGGLQAVIVQLVDHASPLQHGNKHMRTQQPFPGVKPSGERLTAHDPVRTGIHVKLDIKLKLAMLQSVIHRKAEFLLKLKFFLHPGRKQAEILSRAAGTAGCLAGVENHFLQIPIPLLKGVDARGNTDIDCLSVCLGIGADFFQNGGNEGLGLPHIGRQLQQNKAVFRHPGQDVGVGGKLLQNYGAAAENLIMHLAPRLL